VAFEYHEVNRAHHMFGTSSILRLAFATGMAITFVQPALSQDEFKSFESPQGTVPGLNPLTGEAVGISKPAQRVGVDFEAKLTEDGAAVQEGLEWNVFSPIPGEDGKLPLAASSKGGSAHFRLAPGDYFVNVSFGRATATKKLTVVSSGEQPKQVLVLNAGGLLLNAVSGQDVRIPAKDLKFSVYSSDVLESGERGLVVANIPPKTIVRLNAGTYQVVSNYGSVNATVRADIQVVAGKLIEATMQQRAAKVTLKLVAEKGGEAIADTAWSVLASSGDMIKESVSAFPTMVLSEGEYTAIARNKDKIYQRDFEVEAGRNFDVEVLLGEDQAAASQAAASGEVSE
jgi:hypothetical protein